MKYTLRSLLRRSPDTEGVAAVEFAIILSVFLMVVLGIVEFGYDWYLKNALANASRDGARYGVMYRVDANGIRTAPNTLPSGQTIKDVVDTSLRQMLAAGTTWTVDISGLGYTDATAGNPLTVTVSSQKTWSAMGNLIPSLHLDNMTITVSTTMRSE